MKKLLTICLLMFCYISLSATKGCQEDYVLFEPSETATPTPTQTNTPTDDEEDDDDDTTRTPTPTPNIDDDDEDNIEELSNDVKKNYNINNGDNNNNAQNNNNVKEEDEEEDDDDELKANIDMNDLLGDLEGLSQETEDLTWLGNAYSDKGKEDGKSKGSKNDDDEKDAEFLDTDNDGYSDVLELEMDANPNEASSYPVISRTRLYDRVEPQAIIEAQNNQNPKDSDNDGISDDLEAVLGTNQFSKDTDSDGISDFREFENGSDPMISDL